MNINLSPQQLRRAADLKERIESLEKELSQMLGLSASALAGPSPARPGRRRRLSALGLANIRAGVAKRMAATRGTRTAAVTRRRLSPAGRRALSAKLKARWAARKAAGKSRL